MPSGFSALKLAKAITLPVPAESRLTNSQALTHIRTRGGGGRIKTRTGVYLAQLGTEAALSGSQAGTILLRFPKKVPPPLPAPGTRERGQRTPRLTQAPREGCSGLPYGSSCWGAAWIIARPHGN